MDGTPPHGNAAKERGTLAKVGSNVSAIFWWTDKTWPSVVSLDTYLGRGWTDLICARKSRPIGRAQRKAAWPQTSKGFFKSWGEYGIVLLGSQFQRTFIVGSLASGIRTDLWEVSGSKKGDISWFQVSLSIARLRSITPASLRLWDSCSFTVNFVICSGSNGEKSEQVRSEASGATYVFMIRVFRDRTASAPSSALIFR